MVKEFLPLISVIIPVYNGESYLQETLLSISSSTYKNIEILIINDGSTDNSGNICKGFAESDHRIRYIYQENAGIVSARNTGIEHARGDYVCFCDQDDLVSPDMYDKMLNRILQDGSELCICGTCRITDDLMKTSFESLEAACYKDKAIIRELLAPLLFADFKQHHISDKIVLYGTIWKMMINSAFFFKEKKLRFRRYVNFEDDWIMSIELFIYANSISTVEEQLYFWRVNTRSESYNWKYIDSIDVKFQDLDRYIIGIFKRAAVSDNLIQDYKRAKACFNIVKIFENEASPNNKKSIIHKIHYLKSCMEDPEIEKGLEYKKYLKKGYIRYEIVLFCVKCHCISGAYFLNKFLKLMAIYGMNHRWGVKLDKGLKGKRRNGK